jgi:Putative rhamnosyl transferase
MLIATRFGIGISDSAWFEHRLALMSAITAPSLLAQDDQEFEWGIFVGPDLPEDARQGLEEVIAPFNGRAFIDSNDHTPDNLLNLAVERHLLHSSDYVLTGRIDDDDAWARTTVQKVRTYTADWLNGQPSAPGFGLTFENGLVWVMYDMLDVERLQAVGDHAVRRASLRSYIYPWTSISEFVCSPLSIGMTPIKGSHAMVPEELAAEGFEVHVIASDEPMWLYCRHKQTDSGIERATPHDELEISIHDLKRTFGIDDTRTKNYIGRAGRYGYATKKRLFDRRGELRNAFTDAEGKATNPATNEIEIASLTQKASRRREEWAKLGHNLIATPGQDASAIEFCHVIQTPFSVQVQSGLQEFPLNWLNDRLRLLDSYCLPSLAAQTCGDFIWQVYCDENTDSSILQALQKRAERLPQMRISITGPNGRAPAAHALDDTRLLDTVLLTTRLDSDDAISKDYVKAIHEYVDRFGHGGEETLLLNFPRGYQLDTATGRLFFDWMPDSNFHTLFERLKSEPTTVLSGNPSTFHNEHHTVQDDSIPAWLTVIHEGNPLKSLRTHYTGEVDIERLAEFGLTSPLVENSLSAARTILGDG